jgi:hypothetical protein
LTLLGKTSLLNFKDSRFSAARKWLIHDRERYKWRSIPEWLGKGLADIAFPLPTPFILRPSLLVVA